MAALTVGLYYKPDSACVYFDCPVTAVANLSYFGNIVSRTGRCRRRSRGCRRVASRRSTSRHNFHPYHPPPAPPATHSSRAFVMLSCIEDYPSINHCRHHHMPAALDAVPQPSQHPTQPYRIYGCMYINRDYINTTLATQTNVNSNPLPSCLNPTESRRSGRSPPCHNV